GLVLSDNPEDWVRGDVYRLDAPNAIYAKLDEYEGCGPKDPLPHEFRRTVVPVLLDSGDSITASVYIYSKDIVGKQRIESGNFLAQR
nr:gamma-glutamylcyclotransferase [Acidobacteriota bacterium]